MVPTLLLKHEVEMRRPPAVASQLREELSDGAVMGNGVADGLDAFKPEHALFVRDHDAALAGLVPALVLNVVVAAAIRLPDVDLDAGDRVTVAVLNSAQAEERLSLRVVGHLGAIAQRGGIVGVERSENGPLGGIGGLGVVNAVYEQGEAEDIGEEDEFLRNRRVSVCGAFFRLCPPSPLSNQCGGTPRDKRCADKYGCHLHV